MDNRPTWQPPAERRGWPRWLKLLLIAVGAVLLVVVAMLLLGDGGHQFNPHGMAQVSSS